MQTKIIATLGPSSLEYETMKSMVLYGVRIFRLNFSHGQAEDFQMPVSVIRQLENELEIPLTIMGDLSGPKIRIGDVQNSPVPISKGDYVYLGLPEFMHKFTEYPFMPLEPKSLLEGLFEGRPVALSDGMLRFKVQETLEKNSLFLLKAVNEGILSSNKGITFPEKKIALPALTEKDKMDLHQGIELGIDSFALSFVQSISDLEHIRAEIQKHDRRIPVIAKLERSSGLQELNKILEASSGVMVARGDLGLDCSLAQLPILQKRIIKACRHVQKPSIVATQMLLSMVKSPSPTRAEATDVANAILDGADCVMLSEETAIGSYPVEAVEFIHEISQQAEPFLLEQLKGPYFPSPEKNLDKYLAYSACLLADNTDSSALTCHTMTGKTAAQLSSRKPAQPIYALTPLPNIMRELNFYWGVRPRLADSSISNHLERVEKFIEESNTFKEGERVVITSGQPTPGQMERHTNQIKIYYK